MGASDVGRRREPSILHVDMDAFFASVEVLDDPTLAGRPVIVGGSGARGVVASCSYEARVHGVRSAMASLRARRLCPDAVFVEGHFARYEEVSARLREVLLSFTPLVEPIGLDEAFLDVCGALRLFGTPAEIAAAIRLRVREELALDCSVGAGRSKTIAKLASRAAKPRVGSQGKLPGAGVVVIEPQEELGFLHPMGVEQLWGVGPATAKRLAALGARTVGDLARLPEAALVRALGKANGRHLAALARGDDRAPVVPQRLAKSIGREETFREDLADRNALRRHAKRMAELVADQLRAGRQVARTVTVKVKLSDFSLVTRAHTMKAGLDTGSAIGMIAVALLDAVELSTGVRLLGVSVSGLQSASAGRQLRFELENPASGGPERGVAAAARREDHWREVIGAVDAIRRRFGSAAVGAASMVGPEGIVVPARRQSRWGPSEREGDGTKSSAS
ncbi:MAG: DNA polymerase IV [Actinomycetota bacterium]|nr:DNA polymerase IV [Actinomycetota bacterium]